MNDDGREWQKVRPHPCPNGFPSPPQDGCPYETIAQRFVVPQERNLIAQLTAVLGRSSRDCRRKLLVGNGATFGVFDFCPILSGKLFYTEPTETAIRTQES